MSRRKPIINLNKIKEQSDENSNTDEMKDEEDDDSFKVDDSKNEFEDEDDDFVRAKPRNNPNVLRLPHVETKLVSQPIMKLSGMGFKFNERILIVNDKILGYISKKPKDFVNNTMPPKQCIKLDYVLNVGPLDENDLKKYKKKLTEPSLCFKIDMIKSGLYSGKQDIPKEIKEVTDKVKKNKTTWFFLTDGKEKRSFWVNTLKKQIALAKGEQFEEENFAEMEEEISSPDIRKKTEHKVDITANKSISKDLTDNIPNLNTEFDVEKDEEDEEIENYGALSPDHKEEISDSEDEKGTDSKAPEIKLKDLKDTINQYFAKSNELLKRK